MRHSPTYLRVLASTSLKASFSFAFCSAALGGRSRTATKMFSLMPAEGGMLLSTVITDARVPVTIRDGGEVPATGQLDDVARYPSRSQRNGPYPRLGIRSTSLL